MKNFIIILIAVALLVGGIFLFSSGNNVQKEYSEFNSINDSDSIISESAKYTLSEIAEHNSESSCWLLIDNKVYDVTDFIPSHPGGNAILEGCGTDASKLYNSRQREDGTSVGSGTPHSDRAREKLDEYYIGDLE